jgi:hypothetical protein
MTVFGSYLSPYFYKCMGPRHRFQGMNSASLFSLAGRYNNPLPRRFQAPMHSLFKNSSSVLSLISMLLTYTVSRVRHDWRGFVGTKTKTTNISIHSSMSKSICDPIIFFFVIEFGNFSIFVSYRNIIYSQKCPHLYRTWYSYIIFLLVSI